MEAFLTTLKNLKTLKKKQMSKVQPQSSKILADLVYSFKETGAFFIQC